MAGCQPGNTTGKCGRCWRWKYIKYMLKCRNPARDDYDDYEMIMMGRRSNKKNQSQQACTSAMIRRLCKPSAWASWPACREHVKSIHYHHIYHHSSPICQQDWKCIAISSLAAPLGAVIAIGKGASIFLYIFCNSRNWLFDHLSSTKSLNLPIDGHEHPN